MTFPAYTRAKEEKRISSDGSVPESGSMTATLAIKKELEEDS
jgi:hypothetical protein